MHILVCLVLGLVVALAVKRKNGPDILGAWRLVAGGVGACLPHAEWVFWLWGEGAFLQARHGLMWSLLFMPLLALLAAGVLGVASKRGWVALYVPLCSALLVSATLALFTEEGLVLLAPLTDWRLAFAVLHPLDGVVLALTSITLGMAYMFAAFKRDLARVGLGLVVAYVALVGFWAHGARAFGHDYAAAIAPTARTQVRVIPQPLSALNWHVVVEEMDGENASRLHLAHINLYRKTLTKPGRGAAYAEYVHNRYMPLDAAVWQIFWRSGNPNLKSFSATQNIPAQIMLRAWQAGPYGRYARYAAWQNAVNVPAADGVPCGLFADVRYENKRGVFVVCLPPPGRHQPRLFVPRGKTYAELLPSFNVQNTRGGR